MDFPLRTGKAVASVRAALKCSWEELSVADALGPTGRAGFALLRCTLSAR
jgi:hypothetical protein